MGISDVGADQVAAIRPLIAELDAAERGVPDPGDFARFEVSDREGAWVELELGTVNFAYPFPDDPFERLCRLGLDGLPGLAMVGWRAGVFATCSYERSTSTREVARFIDALFGILLGCGEDYPLDVGIARSPEPS